MLGRNFTLFFTAAALSAIGTAMVPVALSFAVLGAGRSAGALGIVLAAETLPMVALLLVGGVAGDRWPRRRMMIGADLLRFAAQSALAAVLIRGQASMPALVGLTALIGVGNAFFRPASGGLIPQLVDRDRLARANAALSAANSMAMILGPSLAGLIVVGVGAGWAIGIDGASYAASALCLAFVRPSSPAGPAATAPRALDQLRDGLRAFAHRRWLWLLVAQFGLLNMVAFAPFMVIAPLMLARLPDGARDWGLLLSALGAGGLVGAFAIMRRQPRRALAAVEVAAAALVAPFILLAAGAPLPAILTGGFVFGAGAAVLNVLIGTVIQREIPTALLSRVTSVVQIVALGLTPVGFALTGPAVAWLGPGRALLAGACTVLVSVVALMSFADIRRFGASTRDPAAAGG